MDVAVIAHELIVILIGIICHPRVLVMSGIYVTRIFLGEELVEFLNLLLYSGPTLVISRLQHHFEPLGILVEQFT